MCHVIYCRPPCFGEPVQFEASVRNHLGFSVLFDDLWEYLGKLVDVLRRLRVEATEPMNEIT